VAENIGIYKLYPCGHKNRDEKNILSKCVFHGGVIQKARNNKRYRFCLKKFQFHIPKISNFKSQISNFKCQMSNFKSQISYPKFQISNLKSQISSIILVK